MLTDHLKSVVPALLACAATVAAIMAAPGAHAALANTDETYLGLNWGSSTRYNLDCAASVACDCRADSSGKLVAGHLFSALPAGSAKISQGLEVMAYKLGNAQAAIKTSTGVQPGKGDNKGVGLSYVAQAKFDDFSLQARIGLSYSQSQAAYANGSSETHTSFAGPTVGMGARYAITDHLSLNADWDRLPSEFNSAEKFVVNMFSFGIGYKF